MEKVAATRDNSFPGTLRIKASSDFRNVFSKGIRLHSENFVLRARPNGLGFPRLGLSVGRGASPSSVKRNRIKRLLREAFRRNKEAFFSNDVVFVVKNDVSGRKFSELLPEVRKLAEGLK